MSFVSRVLRVMIASPSDVTDALDAVEAALHEWNAMNSEQSQAVLLPWRWETDSVPMIGDHPQSVLNGQGVDTSDIVIALFRSRLGSPTTEEVSGTAEEIERARSQGKPVHVFFSKGSLPAETDADQLARLRIYQQDLEGRGLLGTFTDNDELRRRVMRAVTSDVAELASDPPLLAVGQGGVSFVVQPKREREFTGTDKNGKAKHTTRTWVEVTNTGDEDAENVRFESVGDETTMHLASDERPTTVHAGQTRTVNTFFHMGAGDPPVFRVYWTEDDEEKQKDFHVG